MRSDDKFKTNFKESAWQGVNWICLAQVGALTGSCQVDDKLFDFNRMPNIS
jgi:hypothetical protein